MYGTVCQQDKILRILLKELKIEGKGEFFVQSAGITVLVNLPFSPVEAKDEESGKCGDGQKLYAYPGEAVSVT
jgi:hypothetical protein